MRVHPIALSVSLSAAVLSMAAAAAAQMPGGEIIKVSTAVKPAIVKPAIVEAGGTGMLTLTLAVSPGYHINAPKPNDPDSIPTTFQGMAPAGVTFGIPRFSVPKSITVAAVKVLVNVK